MSRIRVLQLGKFYPPQRGGMESHIKTLSESLQLAANVSVVVSNTAAHTNVDHIRGVEVTRVGRLAQINGSSINPAMAAVIKRSEADLIHLHWPNPMAAAAYLLSRHPGRLIVTYHSDVLKQRFSSRLFAPLLDAVLNRTHAIIVSSQRYLDTSPILAPFRAKAAVIPFGISEQHFDAPPPGRVDALRSLYGARIVLSVGRLVDYKGFDLLLQAMTRVSGRLLLAGNGPLRSALAQRAQQLKIADRVVFLGEQDEDELRALYHVADAFVLASTNRREAFGLVQAEAMAAGTPVINTALDSGVPSVSLHGETGCTVTAGDVASLAQAIELLLNNPSLRSRLGRAARLRAEEQFRSVTMASSTLQTYEKILHPGLSQALETIPPSLDLSSSGPLEFATARTLPSKSF